MKKVRPNSFHPIRISADCFRDNDPKIKITERSAHAVVGICWRSCCHSLCRAQERSGTSTSRRSVEISSRRFSLYAFESKNPTPVEMWRLGAIIIITRGITITTRVKILTKLPKKSSLIQIFLVLGLNFFRGWSYI